MTTTSIAVPFVVGVGACLLVLGLVSKYYMWKRRKELEESNEIRLILDTTLTEEQYLAVQDQMDGRSVESLVLHALEIRGFLHEAHVRGQSVYVEDEHGERELDFHFESEQSTNATIH